MTRPLSQDLRSRLVAVVADGLSWAWFKARLHVELGEAGLTLPGRIMAP